MTIDKILYLPSLFAIWSNPGFIVPIPTIQKSSVLPKKTLLQCDDVATVAYLTVSVATHAQVVWLILFARRRRCSLVHHLCSRIQWRKTIHVWRGRGTVILNCPTGRGFPLPSGALCWVAWPLSTDFASRRFSVVRLVGPVRTGLNGSDLWAWLFGYPPTNDT